MTGTLASITDRTTVLTPTHTEQAPSGNTLLFFSSDYPPNTGGIARLCGEITSRLSEQKVNLQVLSTANTSATILKAAGAHLTVTSRRPWRDWMLYRQLRRRSRNQPTICGVWYPDGLLAVAGGAGPVVILAHGSELLQTRAGWRRNVWRRLLRWVCESSCLVIANSTYTKSLVMQAAPHAKVAAIPLGVDHRRFAPGNREACKTSFGVSDKVVVSTVSRLYPYKGHDVILAALGGLSAQERAQLVYLIVGNGPHEHALRRRVGELGLEQVVRFIGFLPEDELPDLYRASDLFVLCTRESFQEQEVEGFGLVFLEAQACGVPVVGTRAGGIADAVRDGEGGWLITQDDSRALAQILRALVSDPNKFHTEGEKARDRVERECTWEHYMGRLRAALDAEGICLG